MIDTVQALDEQTEGSIVLAGSGEAKAGGALATPNVMHSSQVIDRLIDREYLVTLDFIEPLLGSRPTHSIAAAWVRDQEEAALKAELRSRVIGHVTGNLTANGNTDIGHDPDDAAVIAAQRVAQTTLAERDLPDPEDKLNVTGFSADPDGFLHLWDYQIRGFFKGGADTLALKIPGVTKDSVSAMKQVRVLTWVFGADGDSPYERRIYLTRDGERISEPDGLYDRPLRAQTAKGERVSIAVSEVLNPPLSCRLRLVLLKGCRITEDQILDVFSYGAFQGFGQFRSGGFGRALATMERIR